MIGSKNQGLLSIDEVRIRLVALAMVCAFAFLGTMLWRIQVARGHTFQQDLEEQSIRRVREPGRRGRILDRNGLPLADNRPSYCVAIYLEELRQPGRTGRTIDWVEDLIGQMESVLGRPSEVSRRDIELHMRRRQPLPLLAWKDLSEDEMAIWAERIGNVPGVDIYPEIVRVYPEGRAVAHLTGYTGRVDLAKLRESQAEPSHYYLPEMEGQYGVEQSMEPYLQGRAGGRLVRVDVSGYRRQDETLDALRRMPQAGRDVTLSIDRDLERLAARALGTQNGAAVVVDCRTGDVLALVSAPAFHPETFRSVYGDLLEDPARPLVDRAVGGQYPPGSIFKPIVAMAALENKRVPLSKTYVCEGTYQLGRSTFRCAHGARHGEIGLREALARSCNVYFFKLGLDSGYDYIRYMAEAVGLGRKSGIPLSHEKSGLIPSDGWSRRIRGHGWRKGDTVNSSIGQGDILVTPLQMALATAAIANGGVLYEPRLIRGVSALGDGPALTFPPVVAQNLNWSPQNLRVVQNGMRDVVMEDYGTGRMARIPGLTMAAKTGTAEYGPKDERKYRGWMVAYAPFEHPRYAVAVVVEHASSGGTSAGPVVRSIMAGLFGRQGVEAGGTSS